MNRSEKGTMRRNSLPVDLDNASMTDNSLYCGKEAGENLIYTQTSTQGEVQSSRKLSYEPVYRVFSVD